MEGNLYTECGPSAFARPFPLVDCRFFKVRAGLVLYLYLTVCFFLSHLCSWHWACPWMHTGNASRSLYMEKMLHVFSWCCSLWTCPLHWLRVAGLDWRLLICCMVHKIRILSAYLVSHKTMQDKWSRCSVPLSTAKLCQMFGESRCASCSQWWFVEATHYWTKKPAWWLSCSVPKPKTDDDSWRPVIHISPLISVIFISKCIEKKSKCIEKILYSIDRPGCDRIWIRPCDGVVPAASRGRLSCQSQSLPPYHSRQCTAFWILILIMIFLIIYHILV